MTDNNVSFPKSCGPMLSLADSITSMSDVNIYKLSTVTRVPNVSEILEKRQRYR